MLLGKEFSRNQEWLLVAPRALSFYLPCQGTQWPLVPPPAVASELCRPVSHRHDAIGGRIGDVRDGHEDKVNRTD